MLSYSVVFTWKINLLPLMFSWEFYEFFTGIENWWADASVLTFFDSVLTLKFR